MTKKSTDSVKKGVKWSLSCKKPEVSKWGRSLLGFFSHLLLCKDLFDVAKSFKKIICKNLFKKE